MKLIFENELPYSALSEIGINKKAFLNLPPPELNKLMTGRLSNLIECKMKTDNNEREYKFLAKILLQKNKNDDNNVELKIYPIRNEIKTDIALSKKEIAVLKSGGVVQKRINDKNRTSSYIQLDRETNNLITANINEIYVPGIINNVFLTKEQIKKIKKGIPVEIISTNKTITIGVDLEEIKGINIVYGNLSEWNAVKDKKIKASYFLRYEDDGWNLINLII